MEKEKSLGAILQEIRQGKHLSIKEVANRMNIRSSQLEAIENENFQAFSAHVYARGVCERYAHFFELDREEVLRLLEEAWRLKQAPLEEKKTPFPTSASIASLITPQKTLFALLIVGAVGIVSYLGFYIFTTTRSPTLSFDEPPGDMVAYEYIMPIKGTADPRLELTLNKQQVYIDKDGKFSKNILLHPGINILRLEAKNGFGKISAIERRVVVE
jgi:cytoskeletal protein RodZ